MMILPFCHLDDLSARVFALLHFFENTKPQQIAGTDRAELNGGAQTTGAL